MRCQWCGNRNPDSAQTCAFCQRDLTLEQTTVEAVHLLENLELPESDVICPNCGASNFMGTEFCDLCDAALHPGAMWPQGKAPPAKRWNRPPDSTASWIVAWAAFVVPIVGVVALWLWGGISFGYMDGVSGLRRTDAATQQQVLEQPGGASFEAAAPVADAEVDPGVFDDGHQRLIPREKVSAEDRAHAAAANSPKTQAGSGYSGYGVSSGYFKLPLPSGIRMNSYYSRTGSGSKTFWVERSILSVRPEYTREKLEAILEPQGLRWKSSRNTFPKGGSRQQLAVAEEDFEVVGHEGCYIKVTIKRMYDAAVPSCTFTVEHVLEDGWRIYLF